MDLRNHIGAVGLFRVVDAVRTDQWPRRHGPFVDVDIALVGVGEPTYTRARLQMACQVAQLQDLCGQTVIAKVGALSGKPSLQRLEVPSQDEVTASEAWALRIVSQCGE